MMYIYDHNPSAVSEKSSHSSSLFIVVKCEATVAKISTAVPRVRRHSGRVAFRRGGRLANYYDAPPAGLLQVDTYTRTTRISIHSVAATRTNAN